jgi:hypothetical protein
MNKENLIKRLEQESIKGLELYIKDMRSQEECAGYIDGFDEAIELVKKFTLCAVSQHRELLIAFQENFYEGIHDVTIKHIELGVDKYLSNL